jgi:CRP-like cAMP-binding protein
LFLVNYAEFLAKRRPLVDEEQAAEEGRQAIEEIARKAPKLEDTDVTDPGTAMNLAQALAENAETPAAPRKDSDVVFRIVERVVNRNNQAESQQVLVQALLGYDRDHPSERIFSTENLRKLTAGERIIEAGTLSDDLFIVVHGALTVTNGVVITNDAGTVVGEMAAFNGGYRTANVTATTDGTEVLRVPGAVYRRTLRDKRVYDAVQKLMRARVQETHAVRARFSAALTAQFVLRFGGFVFGWMRFLGASAFIVRSVTRLTIALVIEAPLFVLSMFSPRFLRWFIDAHFRDGVGDTAENRRQIRNGIVLVNGLSLAGLVIGGLVALAFGLSGGHVALTAMVAGLAVQILAHFGVNVREVLRERAGLRRQAAALATERDIVAALQPFSDDQPVTREVLARLVTLLSPRANRSLGLANALNAPAIDTLLSQIHPDDGLTRRQLAGIIAPLMVLMTTRETVIDLASPPVRAVRERLQAPEAVVRITGATKVDEIRRQIASGLASKKANDVLVLLVDPSVSDDVLSRPEFSTGDVRVRRNDGSVPLTEDGLRQLTGLGASMSRASVQVSRQVALTGQLFQQIQALKVAMGDRMTLLLLIDEATRAVPVAVEQLAEFMRIQNVIAIQA